MELKSKIDIDFLPFVLKPVRYLGNELNTVLKDPHPIDLHVALCYADVYDTGIKDITFETLYFGLNQNNRVWAERIYAPWIDAEGVLKEQRIPLFSLESRTPLSEFDAFVFYLPEILTIPEVLTILSLSGVAAKGKMRGDSDPLIIGCGPGVLQPEWGADFFDLIVPGSNIGAILQLLSAITTFRQPGQSKAELLFSFSQISGVYIPSFYQPRYNDFQEFQGNSTVHPGVPKQIEIRPETHRENQSLFIPPLSPLTDFTVSRYFPYDWEIASNRECPARTNRLVNSAGHESIVRFFEEAIRLLRPYFPSKIEQLLTPTKSLVANLWKILKEKNVLDKRKIEYSVSDFRWNLGNPDAAEMLFQLQQLPFPIFLGGASSRLRRMANIQLREKEVLDALSAILSEGWKSVHLFSIIGLPTEKTEDLNELIHLVKQCQELTESFPGARLSISLEGFSPRPFTPFQWEKQESPAVLAERSDYIRTKLPEKVPLEITENYYLPLLRTLFHRVGRPMGTVIMRAWELGARFVHHRETFQTTPWEEAWQEFGRDLQLYLSPISITSPLPWDFFSFGVGKAFYRTEKNRAAQGQLHSENRDSVSLGMGITAREFEAIIRHTARNPYEGTSTFQRTDTRTHAALPQEAQPIRYGRKGKKVQMPSAVIKTRIRVRYSKTGVYRFLSHKDLTVIFNRALRMAKIPVVQSQGKKRTLKISYGLPLSSGVASTAEYLDLEVKLGREIDLQKQLNAYLPDGIRILQYKSIFRKVPALAAVVNFTTYEVHFPEIDFSTEWIAEWLAREKILVDRRTKEGVREVDIRPFVDGMTSKNNILEVSILIKEEQTAKITEVLESLLTPQGIDYRRCFIQRTGQFIVKEDRRLTPFEVL